ncbi:phosphatase PAP2 family protein [Gemmatimonadota bacterium]
MKNRVNLVISWMILVILAGPVRAQERPFPYALGNRDLLMAPASLGLAIWGQSEVRGSLDHIAPDEISGLGRSDVNRLDRSATRNWSYCWEELSDSSLKLVIASTIGIGLYEIKRHDFGQSVTMGVMFLETMLLVQGITQLTKARVGRLRPFLYNTGVSVDRRYERAQSWDDDRFGSLIKNYGNHARYSFFSGHTSAAFALATFTSTVFRDIHGPSTWSKLIWGSTLTLATLTAYARVKAGAHYPSDVIAGAIVGGAIGRLVPALHGKDSSRRLILGVRPDRVCLRLQFGTG